MTPYAVDIVEPYDLTGEDTDLTILTAVMALLADHVIGLAATSRRSYLAEFNLYLDGPPEKERPKTRRTPA